MWLDSWMIYSIAIMFGICAFVSGKIGFKSGIETVLDNLLNENIITIGADGQIKRWSSYNKKTRKRKI